MKYHNLFFGLLSLAAVSCTLQEITSPEYDAYDDEVFYATIDEQPGADTKVYADENLKVLWNADDRFSIFNKNTYNQEFRFVGEDGSNAGAIKKVDSGSTPEGDPLSKVYAVYPYQELTQISGDGGVITTSMPSEQTYLMKSFGRGANMMVSATDDNKLRFKNVGGYLSLKFFGAGVSVSSINLRSNNGEPLSGACSISTTGSVPELTMSDGAGDEVTLVCESPVALGATAAEAVQFIFVLPPQTLSGGFSVKVTTPEGAVFEKSSTSPRVIGRSSITPLGAMEVVPELPGNIVFADPEVKAICIGRWDTDKDGELSYDEAAAVTSLNYAFNDNLTVTSFDEFQYFTGVKALAHSEFYLSSGLESVILPPSVESIGYGAFYDCTSMVSITILSDTPPAGADYMLHYTNDCPIFVPVDAVEEYRSADYWSEYADRIFPIGYVPASSVSIDVNELELTKGDTYAFTSSILPEGLADKVIVWSSSKEDIATVTSDGVVTALKVGTSTITANCDGKKAVCELSVVPAVNPDYYSSTDYSQDGTVIQLQQASEGRGINIIIMGDGFVDQDMAAGGKYEQKMRQAMEQFFAYEPYTTFRNRFNVYAVKVVSQNAEYSIDSNRKLTYNEDGKLYMRLNLCTEYGEKVPNPNSLPLKMAVVANTEGRVGRSVCHFDSAGWACGFVLTAIGDVLNHEVGGHGFANLADEYVENSGTFTNTDYLDNVQTNFGWYVNVDWHSDPSTVRWSRFLTDSRYSSEGLGMYEGAYLYPQGIYRATENSMMRYNDCPFNAPSREQIYKTIMKYSEGDGWEYDYETFVAADAAGRQQAAEAFARRKSSSSFLRAPARNTLPLPPVEVDETVKAVGVDNDGNVVFVR